MWNTVPTVHAQPLNEKEITALRNFWASDPSLAAYSTTLRDQVLNSSTDANLKTCAKTALNHQTLMEAEQDYDLTKKYNTIKSKMPESYINRIFPNFSIDDYTTSSMRKSQILKARNGKPIDGILKQETDGAEFVKNERQKGQK